MKRLISNIPYWVYDGLSVISSIITIATACVCIKNAVVDIRKIDGGYVVSFNKIFLFLLLLSIIISILFLFKMIKYAKLLRSQKKIMSFNFYNAAHDLRNEYFDILKKHKKNTIANKEEKIEDLTITTKKFLEEYLNYLCEILETLTGKEIHGCVKLIENMNGSSQRINPMKATVRTFCRSKNSQPERKSNDNVKKSVKIYDNTDFYDILDLNDVGTNACFYKSNLVEYSKKLKESGKKYKNTTDDWEKYYKSTIVAPIRVANEHLFYNKLNKGYDVVGFLCVDSLSTEAFRDRDSDKTNYSYIVKSFAAEMYIILNMYSYYLSK